MRPLRIRFFLTFLAGVVVATLTASLSGTMSSFAATRYEDLSLFTNVLAIVRRNYVEEVDDHTLIRGAVRGMLQELDPHSSFLDIEAYSEMQVDTRGEFHGLGIEITKRKDGYIEVVSPIEGTPANRAGIRARDQIVTICPTEKPADWSQDCRSSKNMSLYEAVHLMRGRKGTEITIEVFRDGFDSPQTFTIVRDVVKIVSVSGHMLEPGYAYVRVRTFQERTTEDLRKVLRQLHEEAERFDGLVLDMRDNPGGLLDQAVRVSNTWLSDGLVVYTKGRVEAQRQEFRAQQADTEPGYPITVLVNEGTASASEIVAGALQDQHRALVIGNQTFGKGSVQTVYPLEGGSGLRLTTALYYTPNGRSIQEVGIAPDILVAERSGPDTEEAARRLREADLEGHFTHGDASGEPGASDASGDPGESEGEGGDPEASAPSDDDLQLARALEVLKSWTYFDRLRTEPGAAMQARASDPTPERPATP
jgi:carboxyl-terminal processing protease